MINGWRVMALQDGNNFIRDEVQVFITHRTDEGMRIAKPIELDFVPGIFDTASNIPELKPSLMSKELATALFEALGYVLIGAADPYNEIRRLRTELAKANSRLDKLIDGIGRLGGHVQQPE